MLKKAISYVYSLVLISRALTFTVSALPVPHNCSAQQQEVHHIVPLSIQEHHESALPLNE